MHRTPKPVLALKATAFMLVFTIITAALVVSTYLVGRGENAYTSLWDRLHPWFYYRAAIILFFSSLLYTPFSYGISYYYIVSTKREARLKDFFYLFGKPAVFCKAVMMRIVIWAIRGAWQIAALLLGVLAQGVVYILTLLRQGENVMNMSVQDLFFRVETAVVNRRFILLSVLIWTVFLLTLALLYVRFMFCKYALLAFEELSVSEAIRIGLLATKGRLLFVLRRYVVFIAYYVLIFLSFGFLYFVLRPYREENFSVFARRLVTESRDAYFLMKE